MCARPLSDADEDGQKREGAAVKCKLNLPPKVQRLPALTPGMMASECKPPSPERGKDQNQRGIPGGGKFQGFA